MKFRTLALTSTASLTLLGPLIAVPAASAVDVSVHEENCTLVGTEQDREDYRRAFAHATESMLENLHHELPSASDDLDAVTSDLALIFPDGAANQPNITPELTRVQKAAGEAGFREGEVLHILGTIHHLRSNDVVGDILPGDVTVTKSQAAHALTQTATPSREELAATGGFSEGMTRVFAPLLDVELVVLPVYRDVYTACVNGESGSFPVAAHLPEQVEEAPEEEDAGDPISRFLSSLFSLGSSR